MTVKAYNNIFVLLLSISLSGYTAEIENPPSRIILSAGNNTDFYIWEYQKTDTTEDFKEIFSLKNKNGLKLQSSTIMKEFNLAYIRIQDIDSDLDTLATLLKLKWNSSKVSHKIIGSVPKYTKFAYENSEFYYLRDPKNRLITIDKNSDKILQSESMMRIVEGSKNVLLLRKEKDGHFSILNLETGKIVHEFENTSWPKNLYSRGTWYGSKGHSIPVKCIRISPSGRYVLFSDTVSIKKIESDLFDLKVELSLTLYDTKARSYKKISQYTTFLSKYKTSPVFSVSDNELIYNVTKKGSITTVTFDLESGESMKLVHKIGKEYKQEVHLLKAASVQTVVTADNLPLSLNKQLEKHVGLETNGFLPHYPGDFDKISKKYYVGGPKFFYNINIKTKNYSKIEYPEVIKDVMNKVTDAFELYPAANIDVLTNRE